jgi:predicted TIM-barrel fold metal-dependent hydrolase
VNSSSIEAGGVAASWDCHVHVFDDSDVSANSHYRAVPRPLPEAEAAAAQHGFQRIVLVQPSVYGTDNSVLVRALRRRPGIHRGVVVLSGRESTAQLRELHDAGVRGVRFNLVSPVGSEWGTARATLEALAPRLRALGWHVQWYVNAPDLASVAECQAATGLPFVLDHLAGLTPSAQAAGTWRALGQLADAGAWVKLSGWYRLQARCPYHALIPLVHRVDRMFGDRLVWGSDWPHTCFPSDQLPSYHSVWNLIPAALGDRRAAHVRWSGGVLYA